MSSDSVSVSLYKNLVKFNAWLETPPFDAHKAAGRELYTQLLEFYNINVLNLGGPKSISTMILYTVNDLAKVCAKTPEILNGPDGINTLKTELKEGCDGLRRREV